MIAQEKTPAFPGAEGFGRYVTGGRGGNVFHVTNLNDFGEGSLRWAVEQTGKKTIVFDVSGTINLQSSLSINSNTTLAGQTSPGGICVSDYPMNIIGNNVIVRYMRFRLGNNYVKINGADGWDGFGGFDHSEWMIDHCSVSWSIDECLSVLGNKNTTVQWCIVAQSLVAAGHTKGNHGYGGNWGGDHASFHHNLLAHHGSRTPRLGPRPTTQLSEYMDMRNNVIYNFGGNGCYGGEGMDVNIVNNYYKPGPGSPTGDKGMRIAAIGIRTNEYVTTYPAYAPALHKWGHYYVNGNVNSMYSDVIKDNWTYGMYNQIDALGNDGTYTNVTKDTIKLASPLDIIYTTTHTAEQAYNKVLAYAGASNHRDSFDDLIVSDTRGGVATYTGANCSQGFINSQNDDKPANAAADWNAWPTLSSTTSAATDTDGDGMPDDWENANGLNSKDANDRNIVNKSGYTNLETYLNSLIDDITTKQNEGGTVTGNIEKGSEVPTSSENILWGQTYIESATTTTWKFQNGFSITNNSDKTYATGNNSKIKFSNGVIYTIIIPDGLEITQINLEGYGNHADAYLSELNGKNYGDTEYIFPNGDNNASQSCTIKLSAPATKTLTFTTKNTQAVLKLTLSANTTTGINHTRDDINEVYNTKYYNIAGLSIPRLSKGINLIVKTYTNGNKTTKKIMLK
jgi:Pectate lyase